MQRKALMGLQLAHYMFDSELEILCEGTSNRIAFSEGLP